MKQKRIKKKELPFEEPSAPAGPEILRRSMVLLFIVGFLFTALLIRILLLQTVGYEEYRQKVVEQMTTESVVRASRGNIYDANGAVLATNITTYRVFLSPSAIASAQSNAERSGENIDYSALISEKLSSVLKSVSPDFIAGEIAKTRYLDRTIAREVSEVKADAVREVISEYGLQRMVYLEAVDTRYYPYETLASQVIGFTGSDGTGLLGLEHSYNDMLAGSNGRYLTARDVHGNEMPYEFDEYIGAENGYNLNTTLDVYVQSALDEQLAAAYTESNGQERAAGIVMDVNTGAILAMGVYPNFNLNDPWTLDGQSQAKLNAMELEPDSEEYAKAKSELLSRMWNNKALTDSYIPGSTFKVITAAMALEEGVVSLNETFNCPGYRVVSGKTIHCHKTTGHGTLTFVQGIQQSCNPVLMDVGRRVGIHAFCQYISAFGYLEKTGIDLPGEGNGIIKSEEDIRELDLAIYSFGQNFNVTLIQQITAVAAVANGGYLVTPHLVASVTDRDGNVIASYSDTVRRQVVSAEVCQTIGEILEEGVSGDGGAKNAYVAGYRIAAKTGTSQKKDQGHEGQYVCSTVAFAPADDPQYAVIIIVDEPTSGVLYGSTVAAPYVANVMETILPYLGVEAIYTEQELQKRTVTAPNCIAYSPDSARNVCERKGLQCEIIGEGNVISRQYPAAGTVMEKEYGKMIFYVGRVSDDDLATVTVPDLVGMTAQAANLTLVNAGLNIRIKGTKNYLTGTDVKVISQSVAAGETVPRGTVVEVLFRSNEKDEDFSDLN